ncbi:RxLR-like protein [Plasmopara halstedii]|uniref:RxLR-like protein n=1 Tax=Plasmopara halstedii TaxID=4781 RepID=A0A0P1A7X2_PLAHL|nr:RxLR-like protein [Plasmopara halstedii]CEG36767.1 RxLR-like protein [Plasmopara halstedii]|eukprot:XP_024573136.1 RxLR-like protein [Plasmopara halstedii]
MHAIVCCVIALVLLDAVVAINMYVVSKATPAIPARNRENEFYRVKMATTRHLREHILATSKAQKETLQDEERANFEFDHLLTGVVNQIEASYAIAQTEFVLETRFKFPLNPQMLMNFRMAEESNVIQGSPERWYKIRSVVEKMRSDFLAKKLEALEDVDPKKKLQQSVADAGDEKLFLLNVTKAQRIIDIPKLQGLQPDQIESYKTSVFSFWRSQDIKSDDLSRILEYTDGSDIRFDLKKWYEIYLNKDVPESSGVRSG